MSAIMNLYVIPAATSETARSLVLAAVTTLLEKGFMAPPARVGAAHRAAAPAIDHGRLRHPQVARGLRLVETREALLAEMRSATRAPELVVFDKLDEKHPDIRREFWQFDGGDGAECAVGFYAVPAGQHLFLESEDYSDYGGGPAEVLLDRVCYAWMHLQGKRAPWTDLFRGSSLERALRGVWPELEVVEDGWV